MLSVMPLKKETLWSLSCPLLSRDGRRVGDMEQGSIHDDLVTYAIRWRRARLKLGCWKGNSLMGLRAQHGVLVTAKSSSAVRLPSLYLSVHPWGRVHVEQTG